MAYSQRPRQRAGFLRTRDPPSPPPLLVTPQPSRYLPTAEGGDRQSSCRRTEGAAAEVPIPALQPLGDTPRPPEGPARDRSQDAGGEQRRVGQPFVPGRGPPHSRSSRMNLA
ncbi:hypothetical protein NDU88_001247 [Pleurodeles waltl]|uniref:Uncharacterized protein n=1 Tax=Pleurodeles waltl TaxID=8319 RepID=A0AAV7WKA9_PLEWA|nr:hypothetical protein NDU88_001247 [Pleurodeles waltl]